MNGLHAILLPVFVELWRRAVRALVWYNGVRRRDAFIPVVVVWASVMLGGAQVEEILSSLSAIQRRLDMEAPIFHTPLCHRAQVLGGLQWGAARTTMLAGTVSYLASMHCMSKPGFHCRVPFSMTWASATSMKMMRSLFSCPRHGTGNLNHLAWCTWHR